VYKILRYIAIIVATSLLTACATDIRHDNSLEKIPAPAPIASDNLNGIWEGELTGKGGGKQQIAFRLVLDDSALIRVFEKNSITGVWAEAMPSNFRGSAFKGNAVIEGTHAAQDGTWVETWVFVVTCKSKDVLKVEFVRMVNNTDLPEENPDKAFSYGAEGVLKRTTTF